MEMIAGVRDLKNKLSHYVRDVKKGRSIMITERGKIVATIVPAQEHKVQSDMNPLSFLRAWLLLPALFVVFACGDSCLNFHWRGLKSNLAGTTSRPK